MKNLLKKFSGKQYKNLAFAPSLSDFAIRFQPRDFMLLAIMGILLVGSLSGESLIKGVFSGALGIAIDDLWEPKTYSRTSIWGHKELRPDLPPAMIIGS